MKRVELPEEKLAIMKKGGVWVPSPLVLDKDKKVLEKWQRLLTLYYIRSGAKTIIPGAHTGEFAGGNLEIYDNWLKMVKEMILQYGEDMFLMSAVSGPDALKQAEIAAKNGYDIVMVAPTAFAGTQTGTGQPEADPPWAGKNDNDVTKMFNDIASIIPAFGFELQRAIPGSREFSSHLWDLWDRIFQITYGAKGASFDTYRSQNMLESAARSKRRDKLVMATGNDDRIVSDLGGIFIYEVEGKIVKMGYDAGLLGHFATDTYSAVQWVSKILETKKGAGWNLPVTEKELAHLVNMCNGALFDALGNFENSVWGVKSRLTDLGLLPAPYCFHESGRPGQKEAISKAYSINSILNDKEYLTDNLAVMKKETGLKK